MPLACVSSYGLDPDVAARLSAMGAILGPEVIGRTVALFARGAGDRSAEDRQRFDDLPYGDHPRQTLDVCPAVAARSPMVLFVPGGGFIAGDKAMYRTVPAFFARHGFCGAIMNYRLAPEFKWPCGSRDVAAALDWLGTNGARFGGDPARMFVVAHSAGAAHAAGILFDPDLRAACHGDIRGAALISGLYAAADCATLIDTAAYYGTDAALHPERSPLSHGATGSPPVIVATAEYDPPCFHDASAKLVSALSGMRLAECTTMLLADHNHISPVLGLGFRTDAFGPALAAAFLSLSSDCVGLEASRHLG